jgi:outer membrane receptor protein involved in Fe transport
MQPGKKIQVETGVKGVDSKFINDVLVQSLQQNNWITDPGLSAKYFLKEQIGAAYASANIAADAKTTIKGGLRYEYTVSNLGTTTVKDIVDRKYGNLFPSFFISHKLNSNNALSLSYSRRITRPTFNDMAPFVIFLDPSTFFSGNSALQPAITDVVKTDYSFKSYLVSIAYSYEADPIAGFQTLVDTIANKQFFSAENLHYRKTVSLTLSVPVELTSWWKMQHTIIGNWQEANAAINNNELTVQQANINFSATWRFKLPGEFSAELSGFYQSRSLSGVSVIKGYGSLNVGVQRKFRRSSLSFTGNNILNTMKFTLVTERPEQHFYVYSRIERYRPLFSITWSRNFGKSTIKEKRNRTTGSEEEIHRVKQ